MERRRQRNVIKQNPAKPDFKNISCSNSFFLRRFNLFFHPQNMRSPSHVFPLWVIFCILFLLKVAYFFYFDQERAIYRRKLLQVNEYRTKRNPLIKNNSFLFYIVCSVICQCICCVSISDESWYFLYWYKFGQVKVS